MQTTLVAAKLQSRVRSDEGQLSVELLLEHTQNFRNMSLDSMA